MIKDYNMETTIKNGELVNKSTQLQVDLDLENRIILKNVLWEELYGRWYYWLNVNPMDLESMKGMSEDDLYHLQTIYQKLWNSVKLTHEEIDEIQRRRIKE